jgi:membrane protein
MSAGTRISRWYDWIKVFLRHYLGGLWRRLDEHHVFLAASGLSFSVIVCIIPFLLVIFSVAGMLLARPTIAGEIDSLIGRLIPYPEYADQVRTFVADRVEEFWVYRRLAGWIGSLGLLFAASGLFSSMRTVLDTVFEIPGKRSAILAKLHDLGLVLMVMVFFLLSTIILPVLKFVVRQAQTSTVLRAFDLGLMQSIIFAVVSFLVIWFGFYMIYVTVPHRRPPHRVLVISSLTSAVLWQAAQVAFGYYIRQFVTFKQIYGAYSFLLVAALWLYYTSVIFIIGAEIGRLAHEWRDRPDLAPEPDHH